MARRTKYNWPDDEKLQALLDEHGTTETARQLGCPPSSLSNRIRQRGLAGSKGRRNGGNPSGESVGERVSAAVDERSSRNGSETASGDTLSDEENRMPTPIQRAPKDVRDAGQRISEKSENGAAVEPIPQKSEGGAAVERLPRVPPAALKIGTESSSSRRRVSARLLRAPSLLWRGPALLLRVPALLLRVPALLRRVPSLIWRALAIVGLASLAGIVAFVGVRGDPKTYQRESSFAIRPSQTVPAASLSDVTGTLAQPDSAVTVSIVDMLGSARLRTTAAQAAGIPSNSVGESGTPYVLTASRRAGSTVIDVRITGPDDKKLLAMQNAASAEAPSLVESVFPLFRLESLSAPAPAVEVGPKIARTVGLAVLLGVLLGITLLLLERKLRSSLGPGTLDRAHDGRPMDTRRSQPPEELPLGRAERVEPGER
jgi:transposase-like protein